MHVAACFYIKNVINNVYNYTRAEGGREGGGREGGRDCTRCIIISMLLTNVHFLLCINRTTGRDRGRDGELSFKIGESLLGCVSA